MQEAKMKRLLHTLLENQNDEKAAEELVSIFMRTNLLKNLHVKDGSSALRAIPLKENIMRGYIETAFGRQYRYFSTRLTLSVETDKFGDWLSKADDVYKNMRIFMQNNSPILFKDKYYAPQINRLELHLRDKMYLTGYACTLFYNNKFELRLQDKNNNLIRVMSSYEDTITQSDLDHIMGVK